MPRRLGSTDIASTSPSTGLDLFWDVYEGYEVVEPNDGPPYLIASPQKLLGRYNPLVDEAPRLFLDFAKIAEHRDQEEALHRWISRYGLLGISPGWHAMYGKLFLPSQKQAPSYSEGYKVDTPPLKYWTVGGPAETIEPYWNEVYRTNNLLTLYEAVLNQDAAAIENALTSSDQSPEGEVLNTDWRQSWESHKKIQQLWAEGKGNYDPETGEYYTVRPILEGGLVYYSDSIPNTWEAFLVDEALIRLRLRVNASLNTFTYPAITSVTPEGPLTVGQLTHCLRPRNLIGAMYLQFYWIITAGHKLPRCKQCRDIIPYVPSSPAPGSGRKHKTHKNKQFCNERCRQNYHYQNRTKSSRSHISNQ
jgi:hypothetical protein